MKNRQRAVEWHAFALTNNQIEGEESQRNKRTQKPLLIINHRNKIKLWH